MAVKEIVPVTDHVGEAIDRLPYKFRDKEKKYPSPLGGSDLTGWEAFITAFVKPIQEFEDICNTILNSLNLETAHGIALDRIGELIGLKREGMGDDTYRNALYIQIGALNSEGRHADISDMLTLIGIGDKLCLETAPASFLYYLGVVPIDQIDSSRELIEVAKAAGVTHELGGVPSPPDSNPDEFKSFTFAGGSGLSFGVKNDETGDIEGGHYTLLL